MNWAHTGRDAVRSVQPALDKRAGVGTAGQQGTCTVSRAVSVPELQMGTEKKPPGSLMVLAEASELPG